jgi:hypothetical protein
MQYEAMIFFEFITCLIHLMESIAHFLDARSIARVRHTSARHRASLNDAAIMREIVRRYPEYQNARDIARVGPLRFALMIEDRGGSAAVWHADDCEEWSSGNAQLLMLRGDVIRDNRTYTWTYWDGARIIPSKYPITPTEFEIPHEFPPEYFAGVTRAFEFVIRVSRYRDQLLATLTPNIGFGSNATFAENGREYTIVFCLHKVKYARAHLARSGWIHATYEGNGIFNSPLLIDVTDE